MNLFFEFNDYILSSLPTYIEHAVLSAPFSPYSLSILLITLAIGILMLIITYTIPSDEPYNYIPPKKKPRNGVKKRVSWADMTYSPETSPSHPTRKWKSPNISKKITNEIND